MDVDASVPNDLDSEREILNSVVKSEPIDSTDLLLDDELRLQIEKSIELVVEEFSRNGDCLTENLACVDDVDNMDEPVEHGISIDDTSVTEMGPVEDQSLDNSEENHELAETTENVSNNSTVVSSSCAKNNVVVELPPKIPNDITVIPINTSKPVNIKSEPRDTTAEADRRFKKLLNESVSSSNETSSAVPTKGIYLPSLTSGKNGALTILPVNANGSMKSIVSEVSPTPTKSKIRSDSGEFSLTADVTIKTVPSTSTSAGNPPMYKVNHSSTGVNPILKKTYSGELNAHSTGHGISQNIRSNSLPNDHRLGLPLTPPHLYPDNPKYCSYKSPSVPGSNSMADLASCSYPSSACLSKSCSVPHSIPGPSPALSQCQQSSNLALMPYSSQPSSFCGSNFNSFVPASSPLSSPKHLKPPINALNSCRMSSSPVPAYMRSREPSYSAPILCDSFSAAAGLTPPETPSYKSTPPWNTPPSSSFRSPTSPATFNFPLPANMGPIAPPATASNPSIFPPCSNQSNALMLPSGHHSKGQNSSYPFRSNVTPSFNPNSSFQRAQCCFSSQIQCFNSACASSSQQQFSIVQHSTRLSNLKSNSIDSMSSLLQYHTYFKKY